MPIKVLEKSVCELIAAGEVVERPASVVKELVENAIDAGADAIEVELRRGGLELIRVTDNGCGIPADEVPTAFLRHATSKISGAQDLDGIATLGFRGEALAAICAVSRVKLVSRTVGSEEAALYRIEGGEECERGVTGAPCGTTITVSDLFFNTPARMKFLKKDVHEGNAAQNIVEQLALSHPEKTFRLVRDGRVAFSTNGRGGLAAVAFCALPREIASNLLEIRPADPRIHVSGLICKPQYGRPSRSLQFVFVNERFVKSRSICAAAEEAGRNLFMAGKHPAFILNVRLPFEDVDINVHPAKTEVRFKNEREVSSSVYAAVKLALGEFASGFAPRAQRSAQTTQQPPLKKEAPVLVADKNPKGAASAPMNQAPLSAQIVQPQKAPFYNEVTGRQFREILDQFEPKKKDSSGYSGAKSTRMLDIEVEDADASLKLAQPVVPYQTAREKIAPLPDRAAAARQINAPDVQTVCLPEQKEKIEEVLQDKDAKQFAAFAESAEKNAGNAAIDKPADNREGQPSPEPSAKRTQSLAEAAPPEQQTLLEGAQPPQAPALRYVGELFETYIVAQYGEQMLLIDKHAAHERILFEKIRETDTGCARQILLEPVIASVSRDEKAAALENAALFERLGFVVEDFGEGELAVREIPTYMKISATADAVVQMCAQLCAFANEPTNDEREWLLHSCACRSAIKAGHRSSSAELISLTQEILNSSVPKFCPHGRPVYITLTQKEIEKQFGRA